jgi:hypothetical protein
VNDEDKRFLDDADPDQVRRAIIEELRGNDGAQLRALLKALRASSEPDAKKLYERIARNPALSDLVPH